MEVRIAAPVGQPARTRYTSRRVGNRARERPEMIEGAREWNDAVGRDFAVCRLEPDDAAGGGGDADGAAGIGRRVPPGAIPVATATADPPLEPPGDRVGSSGWRTPPNAECSLVVAEREFIEIRLADQNGAGMLSGA